VIRRLLRKIYYNSSFLNILGSIYPLLQDIYRLKEFNRYRKRYDIHPSVLLAEGTVLYGKGKIVIGEASYIGRYSSIQSDEGCEVIIGRNCPISHHFAVYTANRVANQDLSQTKDLVKGNVTIGDYTWIGYRVFVNQGVKIGRNCVIGAHSVVTEDIPDYSIAAGVPAKVIGRTDVQDRKTGTRETKI